jgi:rSAM/selenodomain-associated transferase 2
MVSLIIPVLNEEKTILEKHEYFEEIGKATELIFVDGGSSDKTIKEAEKYGKVILAGKGRAFQKNAGANKAGTKYLLFMHVDTTIELETLKVIEDCLTGGTVAGCLTMGIDRDRVMFRIFEKIVNYRASVFNVTDGDLGLFIRKDLFDKIGGFDQVSLMEDILIGKKIKGICRLRVLDNIIKVSTRKWEEEGYIRTFMEYAQVYLKYWMGAYTTVRIQDRR